MSGLSKCRSEPTPPLLFPFHGSSQTYSALGGQSKHGHGSGSGWAPALLKKMRKMASVLSSPLSVDSFMTAGWLKHTEGLNHHMPYKSYQRESHGKQKQSTLRIGALKRKRECEGGREGGSVWMPFKC